MKSRFFRRQNTQSKTRFKCFRCGLCERLYRANNRFQRYCHDCRGEGEVLQYSEA